MTVYVTTKRAKEWWRRKMEEETGYAPSVFIIETQRVRMGHWRGGWRIQENSLGGPWYDRMIDHAPKYVIDAMPG